MKCLPPSYWFFFFLKHNQCFQLVLGDHSEAPSKHLDVRWGGETNQFLSGCLQQLSLRLSSNELAWQREPEVVLASANAELQTSQRMDMEKRMFSHTGKVVPHVQSNKAGWSWSPLICKCMRSLGARGFLSLVMKFKLSPIVSTYIGETAQAMWWWDTQGLPTSCFLSPDVDNFFCMSLWYLTLDLLQQNTNTFFFHKLI